MKAKLKKGQIIGKENTDGNVVTKGNETDFQTKNNY